MVCWLCEVGVGGDCLVGECIVLVVVIGCYFLFVEY